MTDRISTGMMYSQSLANIMTRQSTLNDLQSQLALGKKVVSAKDDPIGAGAAVGLDRTLAELERFGKNANTVGNRLNLQENMLAEAGDIMSRANELAIQSNNGSLTADDRRSIGAELRSLREQLISIANTTDGSGRYLFAGSADDSAPFSKIAGGVVYNGDQTQRRVEIAPETFVLDAVPGSEIFMRVRTGDGTVQALFGGANTGTGVLTDFGRSSSGGWNGETYQIVFTAADSYDVLDATSTVVASGTWTSGEDIVHGGLRLRIEGQPEIADTFDIGMAPTRDVFSTLSNLIVALEGDDPTPAGKAARQNDLQAAMRDVARASEQMIDTRASGGAQLAMIDDADGVREANDVTIRTTLSELRDLDYADAISRYQMETTALKTAQTVFARMQGMSLFDLLR